MDPINIFNTAKGMNMTLRPKPILCLLLLTCALPATLYAAQEPPGEISWQMLFFNLFGGLALFLYGMEKMSHGMKQTAGNKMRDILAALTRNRIFGLIVGAFVTMVIQSSSATTVMLVSFVQAGLMQFTQTLAVILGADIGTTVTAQLIAFKLTDYALLMTALGFALRMFAQTPRAKNSGKIILGFGLLFFGMKLMSDAMKPLRDYPQFIDILKGLENPLFGLPAGALFTALIQSSSAFTGLVIVLAQQGLIGLEAGIPMIFGANIGTCVTAGLASIGTGRDARRVALAHVMFKTAGVLLFIFWIPAFADLIRTITGGSGPARQIANAHTLFNVGLAVIFLPFTGLFERLILKILPTEPLKEGLQPATWHLDEKSLRYPTVAIDLARTEISRMAKITGRMLRAIIIPFVSDEQMIKNSVESKAEARLLRKEVPRRDEYFPQISLLEGIEMREEKLNFLQKRITEYLLNIGRQEITGNQSAEVYAMLSIVKDMESIGDLIHRNMLPLIAKKNLLDHDFSDEGKEELLIYHGKARRQMQRLEEAFTERNIKQARKIMEKERKYLDLELQYRLRHLQRILHERKESVATHEIHIELMDLLKQIIVFSSNIAKTYLLQIDGADQAMVRDKAV